MEVKKVCKNCGKTFVTEDRHKICCCYKCRSAYEQMMKRLNGLPTRHSVSEAVKGFANKKLLSPSQAAEYLGLSRMTLYNYISTGVISCVDLPGRKLISRDELDTLFKNNTHKAAVAINFNDYITFYQMCDVYHRSYNFVRNVCKEQGLKPIIRSSIKYFRKDLVKDAFFNHDLLVKDAKAERDRFYALKHEARRSHVSTSQDSSTMQDSSLYPPYWNPSGSSLPNTTKRKRPSTPFRKRCTMPSRREYAMPRHSS